MDKFKKFLEKYRKIDPALCEAVEEAWDAIIEASATDINPKQIAMSVGSCSQGIIPNELGKSKDPFIQSLIDKSYFGRFGRSTGYTTPGRTTLGMWGGGTDKPGTVSTSTDSSQG